ncbi:MAG: hypothetical protein IKK09_12075 [Clostridia bacterium]|nr:hypothetical protein [Clostridia bacterium]
MKKLISVLLAAVTVFTFAACGNETKGNEDATSEPTTAYVMRDLPETKQIEAADSFSGGTGTEDDPYQISSAAELAYMSELLADDEDSYKNPYFKAYYVLTSDINLNDTANFDSWAQDAPEYSWTPIASGWTWFEGFFDGNGYTVSGMYINTDSTLIEDVQNRNYGLFGGVQGTVKNLTVDKSYICVSGNSATTYMGGIAGNSYESKIENCTSYAVIDCLGGVAGGIIGSNDGEIKNCIFEGTITHNGENRTCVYLGGISGNGGNIKNCVNRGTISGGEKSGGITGWGGRIYNCSNEGYVLDGETSGGITGKVYAAGTNMEIENPEIEIADCINQGKIEATVNGGGIVGSLGNSESDVSMFVKNCVNEGEVTGDGLLGGIVGDFMIGRANKMVIENCTNYADITGKDKVGGIIASFVGEILHQSGEVRIADCTNHGKITATEGSIGCAGVISYVMLSGDKMDLKMTIENCDNAGTVTSTACAGGVIGNTSALFAELGDSKISKDSFIKVIGCKNSGDVVISADNQLVGGIAANWDICGIQSAFENCVSEGTLCIENTQPSKDVYEFKKSMTFARVAGGIIGRVGSFPMLTVDNDDGKGKFIQAKKAKLVIKNCSNIGELKVNVAEEFVNKYGEQVYTNYFGGIIGNHCGEKNYSVFVENCSYSNFDRGLGNKEYEDLGIRK